MKRILHTAIFVSAVIFIATAISSTSFAMPNVADCLEDEADCEEQSTELQLEEDNNDFLVENNANDSLALNIIKMFFALFLVLALIYLAIRFLGKRNNLFTQVRSMENFGGISLGPNRSIQIVRVGERFYLIGVGENVELLEEITDEQLIQNLTNDKENTTNIFQAAFGQKLSRGKNEEKSDFKNLFKTELDQLSKSRKKIINDYKEERDE